MMKKQKVFFTEKESERERVRQKNKGKRCRVKKREREMQRLLQDKERKKRTEQHD